MKVTEIREAMAGTLALEQSHEYIKFLLNLIEENDKEIERLQDDLAWAESDVTNLEGDVETLEDELNELRDG